MSNKNERHTKDHYDRNPKELPPELKGLDFYAVNKIRLNGNDNRTTLFEFRPKQFRALLENIDQTVKKMVSDATKKLKAKLKGLKSELKKANESLVDLEESLDEAIAERDEALAEVKLLTKKPSKAAEDPKKVKELERELQRIKGLFEQKNDENKSLNSQLKNLQAGDQKDKNDLSKALKANADLNKFLSDLKAVLVQQKVIPEEVVQESSGMSTAGTVLSGSTIKITWPKPYRG
jgi:chromosome segregation ATPase